MPEPRHSSITGQSKYFFKDFSRQNKRNMLSKIKVNMQQKKTNIRGTSTTTTKSKMDLSVTKGNDLKPLFFVIKSSILDFCGSPRNDFDCFEWFWMESLHKNIQLMQEFLKAPFLVLHVSYFTLMIFLTMLLSVILLSMLMIIVEMWPA